MVPWPGKKVDGNDEGGETRRLDEGAARDEREMTSINCRYADTRNSTLHEISRIVTSEGEKLREGTM